jgi:hypothetical protein
MLAAHHARSILIDYDNDGEPCAISFIIKARDTELPFRLPANISKVAQVLLNMRAKKPKKLQHDYEQAMKRINAQARRVGWRILRDWVRAQMAIIETEMVTIEQVFLPYMQVKDGQTLYELMNNRGFLLTDGKG